MNLSPGEWGLYQWFEEHGPELIHPNDLDAIRQMMPNGKVFQIVSSEGQYLTLRYGDRNYRVKPDLFKPVSAPLKSFGDEVKILKGDDVIRATISDIIWHFKKSEPYYYLSVDKKRLKKQYWNEDFLNVRE